METAQELEPAEETHVRRELNILLDMTLRMEQELSAVLESEE